MHTHTYSSSLSQFLIHVQMHTHNKKASAYQTDGLFRADGSSLNLFKPQISNVGNVFFNMKQQHKTPNVVKKNAFSDYTR